MDRQPTEGATAYSIAVSAADSMISNSITFSDKQPVNGASNTNGNGNSEVAEVDQLLNTSDGNASTSNSPSLEFNCSKSHEQETWLPLTSGCAPNLLGQVASSSMENGLPIVQEPQNTVGANLINSSVMSILNSPSQSSTLSSLSPSSATLSMTSSPPGSASLLCSPPTPVLHQQGMLIDVLSNRAHLFQASGSQNDEDLEDGRLRVCQWDGCNQQFHTLSSLVAHLDRGHTLSMTKYTCHWKDCPRKMKPFDARYKLITHLRCHTGEKPFKCEVAGCNRCFSRLENLKLHVRTHTGEKPYKCHYEDCTKKFNNTSDRAKHMKTHVMRKPYACKHPGCDKSYTDPSSMRKHIKYSHRPKESGTSSGTGLTDTDASHRNSFEPSSARSLDSVSVATKPLMTPTFVFPSPSPHSVNLSPNPHSPQASLPHETATVTTPLSSVRRSKKLSNGTPLVATGPIISSQPQSAQLIPLPLLQMHPSVTIPPQQQQLSVLPPGIQNGMIFLPAAAVADATSSGIQLHQPQPQVMMVLPSSLNVQPPRETAVTVATSIQSPFDSTSSSGEAINNQPVSVTLNDTRGQQSVETQLRQTIAHLQQQLNTTQNLLAHQTAGIQQHIATPMIRQTPPLQVVLQQLPGVNTPMLDSGISEPSSLGTVQNSNTTSVTASQNICTSINAGGQTSTPEYICMPNSASQHLSVGVSLSTAASPMLRSGGTPFVPVLQPQGLQFLYMPNTPQTTM